MGNWHISIQGVGCHHNQNNSTDANLMARDFVDKLIKAGHTVQRSQFTFGSAESLQDGPVDPVPGGLFEAHLEKIAASMYTAYCKSVGGKAFNGDPLPEWFEFRRDPNKKTQSNAWISAALVAFQKL
jgi:hypothetical protein